MSRWAVPAAAIAAFLVGVLSGYAWWARPLHRLQAELDAVREASRPPTVTPLAAARPAAVIDLGTPEGVSLVKGTWRHSDGRHSIDVTIPERMDGFDPGGSTVVFEVVVDGRAEVWADGRRPRVLGADGTSLASGANAPARVVLTRDARPGQRIQLAVAVASRNEIRSATLDFFPSRREDGPGVGDVVRLHPDLDAVVPPGARIDKIADRFRAVEGPVWVPDGYLLFSDLGANVIYRWSSDEGVSVFRTKSGYAGRDIAEYPLPGSNGLALDPNGRLTIAEHGRRRVVRVEPDGAVTVLADRYEGRRLNSPNDLVYRSDGALYFTDPPFGLPEAHADARRELPYSGIFRWSGGRLQLLSAALSGPNGVALSPDERHLYVTNWDAGASAIIRYDVTPDGTLGNARVFFGVRGDGMKTDQRGNVYVAVSRGVWIISPDGKHLGTIGLPESASNMAWGDDDRRALYMTAATGVYRVRLRIAGAAR